MKISMNWIRQYADIPVSPAEYESTMIMHGTGVEGIEYLGEECQNVVVGRVLTCRDHENSDHLHVCTVDVGQGEPLQIVCGAPNVREGILVPVALIGAKLPGGHEIKKGKLRGVESCGMLCSGPEIGVPVELYPSVGDAGLLIFHEDYPLGTDVRKIFGLDDYVADFEILANRPDCLCAWGIARNLCRAGHQADAARGDGQGRRRRYRRSCSGDGGGFHPLPALRRPRDQKRARRALAHVAAAGAACRRHALHQ